MVAYIGDISMKIILKQFELSSFYDISYQFGLSKYICPDVLRRSEINVMNFQRQNVLHDDEMFPFSYACSNAV